MSILFLVVVVLAGAATARGGSAGSALAGLAPPEAVYSASVDAAESAVLQAQSQSDIYRYDFKFIFTNGSDDYYTGYVFAPSDLGLSVWSKLEQQPQDLGGGSMAGYYLISSCTTGDYAAYDKEEYITSYYDGDTEKTSYALYDSVSEQPTVNHTMVVSDRSETSPYGYIYDPSIPEDDAYFGDQDTCYDFSVTSNDDANFLVAYLTDIPYWQQPLDYGGSCAEVAGAETLAFWDSQGYENLISENWVKDWPNDTASNPQSYVDFIAELAQDMGWTEAGGTPVNNVGVGLTQYAATRGYDSFEATDYSIDDASRALLWNTFVSFMLADEPVILSVFNDGGGHAIVGRGYWSDGRVLADFGWGTYYGNKIVDWWDPEESYSLYAVEYMLGFSD